MAPGAEAQHPSLHQCARTNDLTSAAALLGSHEDLNARDSLQRWAAAAAAFSSPSRTPLHIAAWAGHMEFVRLLVDSGASVSAFAQDKMTPLHFAAQKGHLAVVEYLCAAGASLDALSSTSKTPFYLAIQGDHRACVQWMLTQYPNPFLQTNKKELAMQLCRSEEMKALIQKYLNEYKSHRVELKRRREEVKEGREEAKEGAAESKQGAEESREKTAVPAAKRARAAVLPSHLMEDEED